MKIFNKINFNWGMQTKLSVILIVLVLVAVGSVGYYATSEMKKEMEKEILENQMHMAKAFSVQVDQFFRDAKGVVKTTANLPAVKDVSSIPLIREDIKGVPRDVDRPKRDVINNVIKNYGYFGYMEQITPGIGYNILIEPWQIQLDLKRPDFGFRDWAKSAVAKMDTHVSEVYISSSLQKPVTAISHPVTDDNGNVIAIWMGAVTMDRLSELSKGLSFGKTGQVYLVDQNGVLAAHQNSELIKEIKDVTDVPMVQKAMQGQSGSGLFFDPLVQSNVIATYMPVNSIGWSIVVEQDPDEAYESVVAARQSTIFISSIFILLSVIVALYIARVISRPISTMLGVVSKVTEGDLTSDLKVSSKDEIGKLSFAFNHMIENLRNLVTQIQTSSKHVSASATDLSASSENVAAGATDTANTINRVSATVEQVTNKTQKIALASNQATIFANEGNDGIHNVTNQMEAIRKATETTGEVIRRLNDSTAKISKIVDLITQIADQTNLLALNAAIEAARAGEQGRGFAVVAEEVRKLAEQSAGAAKEIHSLINTIQLDSEKAVKVMNEGSEQVNLGTKVVDTVGDTFEKIISTIKKLAVDIQDIATAAEEMSAGVQNVAASAEEQTATIEEISSTSQNLSKLASDLDNQILKFKIR